MIYPATIQMVDEKAIQVAQEKFGALVRKQLERVEKLKAEDGPIDYSKLDKLIIGVCGGDGIGPYICASAQKVMEFLLADKIAAGKVEIRQIDGLTIERRAEVMKAIPDDTLEELKKCHVILKGPTTTPAKGDPWPNIESANVAMRKELDLFANVRPVSVPELGIDWTFFRENTEGSYALGSDGFFVSPPTRVPRGSSAPDSSTPRRPARTTCPSSSRPTSSRPPTDCSSTWPTRSLRTTPRSSTTSGSWTSPRPS